MSLAAAALTVMAAGMTVSAIQQYQAGKSERAMAEYNAKLAERKGIQEEEIARRRIRQLLGYQKTLYAKAGVDLSEGSPLVVMADTAAQGEKEARNIRIGAQETSALSRFRGQQAARAGGLRAFSTLLTGLGQTGYSAYNYYKKK